MGRLYAVTFENVAVTASQDFFELAPAANKPIYIHYISLTQNTEMGDAAEEYLRVKIIRGHTTGGSGGSTPTARPLDGNDAAAGCTAEANNTTIASAGTAVDLHAENFNIRSGFLYVPTPECRPRCQNTNLLVVRLMANPADSLNMSGTLIFEEV